MPVSFSVISSRYGTFSKTKNPDEAKQKIELARQTPTSDRELIRAWIGIIRGWNAE